MSASKLLAGSGSACPSCACTESTLITRKYAVTALRRCSACELLFRTPTTTADELASFYQREYSQGFSTDTPLLNELEALKNAKFKGTEKDYTQNVAVLSAIGCRPGTRLLDFGCSWGYGSWQLAQAGYDVTAFEISIPRADYARMHLGIDVATKQEEIHGLFDVFFSAHVLEHVRSVADILRLARRLLKPNGWFVALTPNGCDVFRATNDDRWMKSWGLVHPNLLDDKFYAHALGSNPVLLASCPYDVASIAQWASSDPKESASLDLSGPELLIVSQWV